MGRMTVNIDDDLIEEAKTALGEKTRAGAIRRALTEAVRRHRLSEVLKHRGRIALDVDLDELRRLRTET